MYVEVSTITTAGPAMRVNRLARQELSASTFPSIPPKSQRGNDSVSSAITTDIIEETVASLRDTVSLDEAPGFAERLTEAVRSGLTFDEVVDGKRPMRVRATPRGVGLLVIVHPAEPAASETPRIAHAINNPLTIIHGHAESLARLAAGDVPQAKAARIAERILAGAERIARIVDGLRNRG